MEMNYEEFLKQVVQELKEQMPAAEIGIQDVEKMQGESYRGIYVVQEGSAIRATMNLGGAYEQMQDGVPYEEVLSGIMKQAVDALEQGTHLPVEELMDFESCSGRLAISIVPIKGNESMLQNIPFRKMEDMALIARIDLDTLTSAKVTKAMVETFGITENQLFDRALANAQELHPASIRTMAEMLGMPSMGGPALYVATTDDGVKGASVIAYPGFMEEASKLMGGNFYILPSSVHEVLLLSEKEAPGCSELEATVRSINQAEVAPQDRLSDHVYHYDCREKVFERADSYEDRIAEKARERSAEKGLGKLKEKKAEASLQPRHPSGRGKEAVVL